MVQWQNLLRSANVTYVSLSEIHRLSFVSNRGDVQSLNEI